MGESRRALAELELDDVIGFGVILTAADKAFAGWRYIKEHGQWTIYLDIYKTDRFEQNHCSMSASQADFIAAVSGYALGGGCEIRR